LDTVPDPGYVLHQGCVLAADLGYIPEWNPPEDVHQSFDPGIVLDYDLGCGIVVSWEVVHNVVVVVACEVVDIVDHSFVDALVEDVAVVVVSAEHRVDVVVVDVVVDRVVLDTVDTVVFVFVEDGFLGIVVDVVVVDTVVLVLVAVVDTVVVVVVVVVVNDFVVVDVVVVVLDDFVVVVVLAAVDYFVVVVVVVVDEFVVVVAVVVLAVVHLSGYILDQPLEYSNL